MKAVLTLLTIFLATLSLPSTVQAREIKEIQQAIESACSAATAAKKGVNVKTLCRCIANIHVEIAKEENQSNDAIKQLELVLQMYSIGRNSKQLSSFVEAQPEIADIDFRVAELCSTPKSK